MASDHMTDHVTLELSVFIMLIDARRQMMSDDVIVSGDDVIIQRKQLKKIMAAAIVKWLLANIEHVRASAMGSKMATTNYEYRIFFFHVLVILVRLFSGFFCFISNTTGDGFGQLLKWFSFQTDCLVCACHSNHLLFILATKMRETFKSFMIFLLLHWT